MPILRASAQMLILAVFEILNDLHPIEQRIQKINEYGFIFLRSKQPLEAKIRIWVNVSWHTNLL